MSWFSLSMRGGEIANTYSTISGICTGNVAANYLFDKLVKPSSLHTRLRNAASSAVSRCVASRLEPLSVQASDRFLEVSLTRGKWKQLTSKLKESFMQDPKEYLRLAGKIGVHFFQKAARKCILKKDEPIQPSCSSPSEPEPSCDSQKDEIKVTKQSIRFLPGKYTPEQAKQIKGLLKQGSIREAIYQATFFNLKPTCDNTMRKGMNGMVRNLSDNAYDVAVKKILTVTCLPAIYAATFAALQWTAKQCGEEEAYAQLTHAAEMVPSPYTILTLSAIGNTAQMIHAVWQTAKQSSLGDRHDHDKEEVKQTIFNKVRESATRKLMNNQFFSEIGLAKDSHKVEALVESLVSEAVELYWEDLHNKKVLGLPLVA